MPIRSSEGIYSLAEAMYDGTDAELNRYERTSIDAQYARPDDYIYSFAERRFHHDPRIPYTCSYSSLLFVCH
jgi:hypothetical protein